MLFKILFLDPYFSLVLPSFVLRAFAEARDNGRQPWRVTSPYLDLGSIDDHRVVVVVATRRPASSSPSLSLHRASSV